MLHGSLDLPTLLQGLRAGDKELARQFVTHFEPYILRELRLAWPNGNLRRMFDSADVAQSVFRSFFVRMRLGEYDLSEPPQLYALLRKIARNKLLNRAREQYAECRDIRRDTPLGELGREARSPELDPLSTVSLEDLIGRLLERLPPDVRRLAQDRLLERTWTEIAERSNDSAESLRKRFRRAVDMALNDLGWEADLLD
jgi:RNA polymerase sigma factor (sigma-70 family)